MCNGAQSSQPLVEPNPVLEQMAIQSPECTLKLPAHTVHVVVDPAHSIHLSSHFLGGLPLIYPGFVDEQAEASVQVSHPVAQVQQIPSFSNLLLGHEGTQLPSSTTYPD